MTSEEKKARQTRRRFSVETRRDETRDVLRGLRAKQNDRVATVAGVCLKMQMRSSFYVTATTKRNNGSRGPMTRFKIHDSIFFFFKSRLVKYGW